MSCCGHNRDELKRSRPAGQARLSTLAEPRAGRPLRLGNLHQHPELLAYLIRNGGLRLR